MIRVLFISSGLGVGGAETSLLNLLRSMDRSRFDPHVISLTGRGEVGEGIAALGVPVQALEMGGVAGLVGRFTALVRAIRRLRPDIVQTWMYHGDLFGSLAARLAGVDRVAWGIRNSNLAPDTSKRSTIVVARLCARLSRRLPRTIVSCSSVARDVHVALGYDAGRFTIIPNGFDVDDFSPDPASRSSVRAELGLPDDTPLVAVVGRFDPQKDHAGFLRSAGLVHRQRPDAHYLLIGKGLSADNDEIAAGIRQAGTGHVTHLLGLRRDTSRLLAASDMLVLSSSYGEAFPRVVGEAMACGIPCVVTDVGDSAYIVDDTGLVVAPRDAQALADAMLKMLQMPTDERQALGARARERVCRLFEIGSVTRRYESLYEAMSEDRPCAA